MASSVSTFSISFVFWNLHRIHKQLYHTKLIYRHQWKYKRGFKHPHIFTHIFTTLLHVKSCGERESRRPDSPATLSASPVAASARSTAADSRDDAFPAVKHFIWQIPGGAHETRYNHAIGLWPSNINLSECCALCLFSDAPYNENEI